MGGIFDGVPGAQVQRRSSYLRPGRYLVRLDKATTGTARSGVEFVCFNLVCLAVVSATAAANNAEGPHREGDEVTWMIMKNWKSFDRDVKTAIIGFTGCTEDEITVDSLTTIFGPSNPLGGMFFEIDAVERPTQKGGTFTVCKIVRELPADEVKARVSEEHQSLLED